MRHFGRVALRYSGVTICSQIYQYDLVGLQKSGELHWQFSNDPGHELEKNKAVIWYSIFLQWKTNVRAFFVELFAWCLLSIDNSIQFHRILILQTLKRCSFRSRACLRLMTNARSYFACPALVLPCLACPAPVLPKCSTILPRDLLQWEVGAAIFISSLSTAQTFLITFHQLLILLLFMRQSLMTNANSCGTLFPEDTNMFREKTSSMYMIPFHKSYFCSHGSSCWQMLVLTLPLLPCLAQVRHFSSSRHTNSNTLSEGWVPHNCLKMNYKTCQYQVRFWLKV